MTSDQQVLIGILAKVDAAFLPVRRWKTYRSQNVAYIRRHYAKLGIDWASGKATAGERIVASRALESLVDEKLIKPRKEAGKTVGVRLTDRGDQYARAIAGRYSVGAGLSTMAEVERLAPTIPLIDDYKRAGWVPEIALNNGRGWGSNSNELWTVWAMAAPALCRGWLDSTACMEGRAWLRLTASGQEALHTALAADPENFDRHYTLDGIPDPREAVDEAVDEYVEQMKHALAALDNTEPADKQDIGLLAISCSPFSRASDAWLAQLTSNA